jgi:sugar-specific transcriptional regulator TrmB
MNLKRNSLPYPPTTSQAPNHKGSDGAGVLVGLGLSERQARLYLALLKEGKARARPLAVVAHVPRQEVYNLLLELRRLGLARQNLTAPATYTAAPFTEAAKILFERRANELTLMSREAEKLSDQLSQTHPFPLSACFGAVFEGEGGRQYQKAIAEAQESIEGMLSWMRFREVCFHFEAELKAALKRGVHVRIAAEKPPNHQLPKWLNTLENGAFELRTMPNPPVAVFAVFDGAKVAVAFNSAARLSRGPDLWSTHPGLAAVCRGYFDRHWATL